MAMRTHTRAHLRNAAVVGAIVALCGLSSAPPVGANQRQTDPAAEAKRLAEEREQLKEQRAKKATQIDALQADNKSVSAALEDLSANVAGQQDRLLDAQNSVEEAERQATEAKKRAKEATAKLATLRAALRDRVLKAYTMMPSEIQMSTSVPSDATDLVNRQTYIDVISGNDRGAVEQVRMVAQDLDNENKAAEEATARAQERRAEASSRLAELQQAQAEQLDFQEGVADRIAAATAEANGLAAQDEKLSKELVKQQLALAAQLKKAEEERKRREAALVAAKVQAISEAKAQAAKAQSSAIASGGPVTITGSGEIVDVGGIEVHKSIADNLSRLLSAARAAGINFGGGGYRSSQAQINVRRNNCGSSNYAIYEAPSSYCSPPTARPGASQHERGLAIDFEVGGSTLTRGSAGYQWLKANGANYGFYNLPSEAWHWSTTGN